MVNSVQSTQTGRRPVSRVARRSKSTKLSADGGNTIKRFNEFWEYSKQNNHDRWKRNYKLYNNIRVAESYKGISNTFVPMVFSTIETLTAALASGKPSIDFVPQDMYKYIASYQKNGRKPDLSALNAQFDYFWDKDNWDVKSIKTIRSTFMYGLGGEWFSFEGGAPHLTCLGVRDAIYDPTLSDPNDLVDPERIGEHWGGRRYLTTLDALRDEKIINPETGELVPRFSNLAKVTPGSIPGDDTEKQLKETFLGAVGDASSLVEVIEIHDKDYIRSVANRGPEIECRKNELGIVPLGLGRFIADESLICGKSIIDPIAKAQEYLNDVTNQRLDAVTDALLPERTIDPKFADWIPRLKKAPGTVYPFGQGALSIVEQPQVPVAAFTETQNMKNEIREATGADQVVKGVSSSQNQTATEIKAQLNQAGQRFEIYARMLERETFYQRAKIVLRMLLKYGDRVNLIPTTSMDGPKFRVLRLDDFDTTYEPQIRLETTVKSQQYQSQQKADASFKALIADPTNDLWEVKKIMYPKMYDLSEEELDRIIGKEKPQPTQPADPIQHNAPQQITDLQTIGAMNG